MTTRLHPRLALWHAGSFYGILGIVVLLPIELREDGFDVVKTWGLGNLAAPLCLIGGLPGAMLMGLRRGNNPQSYDVPIQAEDATGSEINRLSLA